MVPVRGLEGLHLYLVLDVRYDEVNSPTQPEDIQAELSRCCCVISNWRQ